MPSSTSNSEDYWVRPMPERSVPAKGWTAILLAALAIALAGAAGWEIYMRQLGLAPDLGDGKAHWAIERRKIDRGDVAVAIVGSSRILFNTNLDEFERLTGTRPVQLALPGTPPRAFLHDLAEDPDFRGLAIVGVTPGLFFGPWEGLMANAIKYPREQTPSERMSYWLSRPLKLTFAFLDDEYRPFKHIERLRLPPRTHDEPYGDVWKIATTHADRQTYLWKRVETDPYVRAHAVHAWAAGPKRPPLPQPQIDKVIAGTVRDVAAIRARGGEVVFVNSSANGGFLIRETMGMPRARTWEPLLARTRAAGFHYADHDATRGLVTVEDSHLNPRDAVRFTRAYVSWLQAELARRGRRIGDIGKQPALR